jgi:leucyl-tRNA synthetase
VHTISSRVFTTRPDTLFGASLLALSADHPMVQGLAKSNPACRTSSPNAASPARRRPRSRPPRRGLRYGPAAKHPLIPGKTLPVYIANFVLMDYGTGAIFGCPAHDQRDLDFATKYGLPILPVVARPTDPRNSTSAEPYVGDGLHREFRVPRRARRRGGEGEGDREARGDGRRQGTTPVSPARLGSQRQRYWGCPIPIDPLRACGPCRCRTRTCR